MSATAATMIPPSAGAGSACARPAPPGAPGLTNRCLTGSAVSAPSGASRTHGAIACRPEENTRHPVSDPEAAARGASGSGRSLSARTSLSKRGGP